MIGNTNSKVFKVIKQQGLLLALFLILTIFSLLSKAFFSMDIFILILRQVAIIGIIAYAMTFVIIAGNFDLTVGAVVSMVTIISVNIHDSLGPFASVLIPVVVGLVSGFICGLTVGYLKLNSLIVTLGIASIIQGITLIYSGGGHSIIKHPETSWFSFIGRGLILGFIPFPVVILVVLVIVFELILRKTVFGKQLLAVGGNPVASRYTGINDKKIVLTTFILSGFMSGIAGVVLGSRVMSIQPGIALGYEFNVITAVILGGTSLLGGEGSVLKTLIGVIILGTLQVGFVMLGLPYYSQWIVEWFIIIFVVWLNIASKKKETAA